MVIIVGATHDATAGYRADADQAYAEAIKYTSNVVKVYSPYATWAKVKAAVAGASVVIYMGHGNGWPSPYTFDANYTTKDGFGLNATYNAGDYNNKYYGEPSVATLDLAPGAIILLHHLCYASGNSEPGNPEPTLSVARQRADNYAAGFFKAGASAVIADGHSGAERYLRDLFTTHQTIEQMWRNQSNANGHFASFSSVRTPGATVTQDPMTPTSGFYRSVAINTFGITTDKVVSGGTRQHRPAAREHRRPGQGDGRGPGRAARWRPVGPRSRDADRRRRRHCSPWSSRPSCPSTGHRRPSTRTSTTRRRPRQHHRPDRAIRAHARRLTIRSNPRRGLVARPAATTPDRTRLHRTTPDRDHRAMDRPAAEVHRPESLTPRRTRADDHEPPAQNAPSPPDPAASASSPSACCSWPRPSPSPQSGQRNRRSTPAPPAVIGDPQGSVQPTIQYEEAVAHAGDRIPFTAGERVTVPFKPRGSDRWTVADEAPRSLPAGRLSGRAIRAGVAVPRFDPKASATDVSSRAVGPGRRALGGPMVGSSRGPGSGGQSGRPPARGVRLPAVLGADRPVDQARLVDALDDRLLRGRGRRQRGSPAQERRRIDDRGLERLDELEDDRRSSTAPTPTARASC